MGETEWKVRKGEERRQMMVYRNGQRVMGTEYKGRGKMGRHDDIEREKRRKKGEREDEREMVERGREEERKKGEEKGQEMV